MLVDYRHSGPKKYFSPAQLIKPHKRCVFIYAESGILSCVRSNIPSNAPPITSWCGRMDFLHLGRLVDNGADGEVAFLCFWVGCIDGYVRGVPPGVRTARPAARRGTQKQNRRDVGATLRRDGGRKAYRAQRQQRTHSVGVRILRGHPTRLLFFGAGSA